MEEEQEIPNSAAVGRTDGARNERQDEKILSVYKAADRRAGRVQKVGSTTPICPLNTRAGGGESGNRRQAASSRNNDASKRDVNLAINE